MTSDKEYVVKGSIVNGIGLVTRMVSPMLVFLLARFFPQREIGLYLSFQAMIMVVSRFALLGLDKGLLWYLPKFLQHNINTPDHPSKGMSYQNSNPTELSSSVWIATLISIPCIIVVLWLGLGGHFSKFKGLSSMSMPFLVLMTLSILPFSLIQILSAAMEGVRKPQYRVLITLFFTTSSVPVLSILLRNVLGHGPSLGMGMLLGYTLGCLLFVPVIYTYFVSEKWFPPKWPSAVLLKYSLPLAMTDILSSLYSRVDVWMILFLLGPEKVAVYSVMITITNGLRTVRQAFDPIIIPVVSQLNEKKQSQDLPSIFSYATNMVSTLQLPIALFMMLFPREILSIAGHDYAIEITAFVFLLLGNLANGFLGLNGQVLLGLGRSKVISMTVVGSLLLNTALNWILIPKYGIVGAAIANSGTIIVQNILLMLIVVWVEKLWLYQKHLWINGAVELSTLLVFVVMYRYLELLGLGSRIGVFAGFAVLFGAIVYAKRKTFKLA